MTNLHLVSLFSIAVSVVTYRLFWRRNKPSIPATAFYWVLGIGLFLRMYIAYTQPGFSYDMNTFTAWSERMVTHGASGFYSTELLTDYPPLFMWILYAIGVIRGAFEIPMLSPTHILMLKMPSILCDVALGYLIYRIARKRYAELPSLALLSSYLFLPAILINSAAWGQVDATQTLAVVLLAYFITEGKLIPAYVTFGIGILLKPQTLIFTPILLVGIYDHVFRDGFDKKKFFTNLFAGLAVIVGMFLVAWPFGWEAVIRQYQSTLTSYPHASANAYNFWAMLGLNWYDQSTLFLFLPANVWGTLVILSIVAVVFVANHRMGREPAKYFLLSAFIIITMFVFSVRMHERYVFPALALLLFTFIYRPSKGIWQIYTTLAVLLFYNTAHVLYFYDPEAYQFDNPVIFLISTAFVFLYPLFIVVFLRYFKSASVVDKESLEAMSSSSQSVLKQGTGEAHASDDTSQNTPLLQNLFTPRPPQKSKPKTKWTRLDALLLLGIVALYSGFALHDLGDTKAPSTQQTIAVGETITVSFPDGQMPGAMSYYIAPEPDRALALSYTKDGMTWESAEDVTLGSVFTWQEIPLPEEIHSLRLTPKEAEVHIVELAFRDGNGEMIPPSSAAGYDHLFDEAPLVPEVSSFRNSMYFDEIYHGRTAYEFLHGLPTYENTHPPLGKVLISLGVALFGMTPFGWRIVGTLFGILMLAVVYAFGKKLLKNTALTALATFLFAFDFMHFAQTRIATIDVYVTFFVILSYAAMYDYTTMSFYDTKLSKTFVPLGISGVAIGLAIASKWSGVYSGIGLAILFFHSLWKREREYQYAKKTPKETTNGISHADVVAQFSGLTSKTILFCVGFFVVIPLAIYLLSYLPYVDPERPGLFARALANQERMLSYHGGLTDTHPFSSRWYEWPLMIRPIWYYSRVAEGQLREGISAFGNPLVWWVGIPAFFFQLWFLGRHLWKRISAPDENAQVESLENSGQQGNVALASEALPTTSNAQYASFFVVIAYLAGYLPWAVIQRETFIYHYFPSVVFVVFLIALTLKDWKGCVSPRTFIIGVIVYGALAFSLFLLFYPVLSGQPVDLDFVKGFLRWLPDWFLVAG